MKRWLSKNKHGFIVFGTILTLGVFATYSEGGGGEVAYFLFKMGFGAFLIWAFFEILRGVVDLIKEKLGRD